VRNPFSRPGDLHGLFEGFCFHRFLAQHPLQFTDLLERIAQLGDRDHGFTSADCRQAARSLRKQTLSASVGVQKVSSPELQVVNERIARLEAENQRLRMENDRLLGQFVRWAYNAYIRGLDEQFLARPLPIINR
jgi:DNA-binding transcriptional MerR regulator